MSAVHLVLTLLVAQRLGELMLARANTTRLLALGGIEAGARHYLLFPLLHGGWIVAMALLIPADAKAEAGPLVLLGLLLLVRLWTMASLGARWTTRIVTLPAAPLVCRGPYRFVRHPNYLVVAGEIAVVPLIFGAWRIALVFSLLNGLLLAHRIQVEDQALRPSPLVE
jgi:methyltransferase